MEKNITQTKNVGDLFSKRSISRLMAVQALYQYQYNDREGDILEIVESIVDNYAVDSEKEELSSYRKKVDMVFLRNLVAGVLLVIEKVDEKIAANIEKNIEKNQDFAQIPDVLLQILRLGAFELLFMKDIPFKIIINEYVNVASSFYDASKVNFVNAVLDKIAKSNA